MAIKGQIEAIIYAAEEPVTLEQIALVLKDSVVAEHVLADAGLEGAALESEVKKRVREAVEELTADYANSDRGMEVREVAGGYRMGTKPEHHDVVRHFAKNLKPPVRLSMPALETLAVIAYKQPVAAPQNVRDSRRGAQRRAGHAARPQADHHRGTQAGDRAADFVQDEQGFS